MHAASVLQLNTQSLALLQVPVPAAAAGAVAAPGPADPITDPAAGHAHPAGPQPRPAQQRAQDAARCLCMEPLPMEPHQTPPHPPAQGASARRSLPGSSSGSRDAGGAGVEPQAETRVSNAVAMMSPALRRGASSAHAGRAEAGDRVMYRVRASPRQRSPYVLRRLSAAARAQAPSAESGTRTGRAGTAALALPALSLSSAESRAGTAGASMAATDASASAAELRAAPAGNPVSAAGQRENLGAAGASRRSREPNLALREAPEALRRPLGPHNAVMPPAQGDLQRPRRGKAITADLAAPTLVPARPQHAAHAPGHPAVLTLARANPDIAGSSAGRSDAAQPAAPAGGCHLVLGAVPGGHARSALTPASWARPDPTCLQGLARGRAPDKIAEGPTAQHPAHAPAAALSGRRSGLGLGLGQQVGAAAPSALRPRPGVRLAQQAARAMHSDHQSGPGLGLGQQAARASARLAAAAARGGPQAWRGSGLGLKVRPPKLRTGVLVAGCVRMGALPGRQSRRLPRTHNTLCIMFLPHEHSVPSKDALPTAARN